MDGNDNLPIKLNEFALWIMPMILDINVDELTRGLGTKKNYLPRVLDDHCDKGGALNNTSVDGRLIWDAWWCIIAMTNLTCFAFHTISMARALDKIEFWLQFAFQGSKPSQNLTNLEDGTSESLHLWRRMTIFGRCRLRRLLRGCLIILLFIGLKLGLFFFFGNVR